MRIGTPMNRWVESINLELQMGLYCNLPNLQALQVSQYCHVAGEVKRSTAGSCSPPLELYPHFFSEKIYDQLNLPN